VADCSFWEALLLIGDEDALISSAPRSSSTLSCSSTETEKPC